MKSFLLSLKTTVWTLFVLVCLFFIGSYMMPVHREVFAPMNDDILFHWVGETAAQNLGYTWWFFAALAGLVLLTANTIACSVKAVREKWTRSDFLLRLSPQIVHAGFLFILLAHLLGAGWGYKLSGPLPEGSYGRLPEGRALHLGRIDVMTDARGFTRGWNADVSLYENDRLAAQGSLGPNRPLFYRGVGVYLKHIENTETGPVALLVVARDPGAFWALAGGIFFILGSITLLALKWKQ